MTESSFSTLSSWPSKTKSYFGAAKSLVCSDKSSGLNT
jgi:hypothetical protein